MTEYAAPQILVSTEWVAQHAEDTEHLRIIESNEDPGGYKSGHLPNALEVSWRSDLQDPLVRDFISKAQFEKLCSELGITNDMTVVFYGDKSNWWACYAFWVFKLYGHPYCLLMDGGRAKWIAENRPLATEVLPVQHTNYVAQEADPSIRAFRQDVYAHAVEGRPIVDVRSDLEYRGVLTHMPDYPQEGALRAGHIPGAINVPWNTAVGMDGTFKSRTELEHIYRGGLHFGLDTSIVTYCRIGERSSHTWFVLKYLLGFSDVKNYDGSWTEWGNLIGAPVVKGSERGAIETPRAETMRT